MSIWNSLNLTLKQMREQQERDLEIKNRGAFVWPKEDLGDLVLLNEGYEAFKKDVSADLVE